MSAVRNFILCLAVLFLSSCIPVDDFGTYWNKGTVNAAVTGKWQKIERRKKAEFVRITDEGGRYRIDTLDKKERGQKDYSPIFAKTLTAGKYTFFMAMSKKSGAAHFSPEGLVRYDIHHGVLTEYNLVDRRVGKFLADKFPHARNITAPKCRENCVYDSVKIRKLDAEVVKVLAAIPDTGEFWTVTEKWKRVK
ncbi:MAG: hypothetical protein ACAH83_00245 [Alphaproteobacteria bacterium]